MSAAIGSARPPLESHEVRGLLELGGGARDERDARALSAKRRAIERPMPRPAPVTRTVRSANFTRSATDSSSSEELSEKRRVGVAAREGRPGQERHVALRAAGRSIRTRSTSAGRAAARDPRVETRPWPARAWIDAVIRRCSTGSSPSFGGRG